MFRLLKHFLLVTYYLSECKGWTISSKGRIMKVMFLLEWSSLSEEFSSKECGQQMHVTPPLSTSLLSLSKFLKIVATLKLYDFILVLKYWLVNAGLLLNSFLFKMFWIIFHISLYFSSTFLSSNKIFKFFYVFFNFWS